MLSLKFKMLASAHAFLRRLSSRNRSRWRLRPRRCTAHWNGQIRLIISGSGPTDRDGNLPIFKGPNNSLKLLAEGLAAHGIASVRYDKRGIGETGKAMMLAAEKAKVMLREEDLSFETYIDDAVAWCKKLGADRSFSSLTVLGHSEGSLIGMVAAQRMGAHAYVSIAGSGRPSQELILEQVKPQ